MWLPDEWQTLFLCIVLGVLIPLLYTLRMPFDSKSKSSNSKSLLSFQYIGRPITSILNSCAHIGWIGPTVSISLCVITSIIYHYEDTTTTHCDVPNPLPSISAAVGNNLPERWYFRFGVVIMAYQRFFDGAIHYAFLQRHLIQNKTNQTLNGMLYWFHQIENMSLFMIGIVSSTEYYPLHEKSFIMWAIFQEFKMLAALYLGKQIKIYKGGDAEWENRSYRVKVSLWLFNGFCLILAGAVFVFHNTYCVAYLYALYAFLEYVIVFSNILFNSAILRDCMSINGVPVDLHIVVQGVPLKGYSLKKENDFGDGCNEVHDVV
jgi:hypothetical protein